MIMKSSRKMKEHLFFSDTMEFIRSFQSEAPLKRSCFSTRCFSSGKSVSSGNACVLKALRNGNVLFLSLIEPLKVGFN